jgi:TPR repeat protein
MSVTKPYQRRLLKAMKSANSAMILGRREMSYKRILLLFAVSLVAGHFVSGENTIENEEPRYSKGVSTADRAYIPKEELASLEQKALDGSIDAASKVLFYYMTSRDLESGLEEMLFWATISAENGSHVDQYHLADLLELAASKKSDPRLLRRSCYWLKRASESGVEGAIEEIEDRGCKKMWLQSSDDN